MESAAVGPMEEEAMILRKIIRVLLLVLGPGCGMRRQYTVQNVKAKHMLLSFSCVFRFAKNAKDKRDVRELVQYPSDERDTRRTRDERNARCQGHTGTPSMSSKVLGPSSTLAMAGHGRGQRNKGRNARPLPTAAASFASDIVYLPFVEIVVSDCCQRRYLRRHFGEARLCCCCCLEQFMRRKWLSLVSKTGAFATWEPFVFLPGSTYSLVELIGDCFQNRSLCNLRTICVLARFYVFSRRIDGVPLDWKKAFVNLEWRKPSSKAGQEKTGHDRKIIGISILISALMMLIEECVISWNEPLACSPPRKGTTLAILQC